MMIWILVGILISGEALYRWGIKAELTRKLIHTLAGCVLVLAPWLWTQKFALGVGVVFTCFLLVVEKYKILPSITNVSRSTSGGFLFPLGITLAVIIGWDRPPSFQAAVLDLALADTLAWVAGNGIAGQNLPKKWPVSVMFGLACQLIWIAIAWNLGLVTPHFILGTTCFSGLLLIVEYYSSFGTDNLFIPVLSSLFGLIVF